MNIRNEKELNIPCGPSYGDIFSVMNSEWNKSLSTPVTEKDDKVKNVLYDPLDIN
jgi:hypothetical protein